MDEEQQHLSSSRGHSFNPSTLLQHCLITQTTHSSPLTKISLFINRATTTRIIREQPSDDPHNDWAKPVIIVDVVWNLAFVFVSIVLLFSTFRECPSTPLRIWIGGYALQCVLHVGFVYVEHRRRRISDGGSGGGDVENLLNGSSESRRTSVATRLESMNTMVSFVWWMIGFYWIVVGGQVLLQDAPRLYSLTVVFLAFDVFFAIFCVVLVCLIGIAIFCCLPCIIVMLYSMVVREGASEEDIRVLPRYKFRQIIEPQVSDMDWKQEVVMEMESTGDSISEISLLPEDSQCCICLSKYVDGVELHSLPCSHHFHCGCIAKWLRINAKCPLCKKNVLGDDELV